MSPPAGLAAGRLHSRSAQATPTNPIDPRITIRRSWIDTTSGPGSVVSSVNASPPCGIGRQRSAKQNQCSPALINFHFGFGDLVPVNSKKCDAGRRHLPTGNRRPPERKLMTGGPFGRAGGKPQRMIVNLPIGHAFTFPPELVPGRFLKEAGPIVSPARLRALQVRLA